VTIKCPNDQQLTVITDDREVGRDRYGRQLTLPPRLARRCPKDRFPGFGLDLHLRPLGYEANGTHPTPLTGFGSVLPG